MLPPKLLYNGLLGGLNNDLTMTSPTLSNASSRIEVADNIVPDFKNLA